MIWFAGSKEVKAEMLRLEQQLTEVRTEVSHLMDEKNRRRARNDWFLTKLLPAVGVLVVIVSTLNGLHWL